MAEAAKLQIPDDVLQRAKEKCRHAFSCLTTGLCGDQELCAVDYATTTGIYFLKDRKTKLCPNRLSFGDRQICFCPVRAYAQGGLAARPGNDGAGVSGI